MALAMSWLEYLLVILSLDSYLLISFEKFSWLEYLTSSRIFGIYIYSLQLLIWMLTTTTRNEMHI